MNVYDFRKSCTPDQLFCVNLLSEWAHGDHHLPNKIHTCGQGVSINHYGDLSTWDFDRLTALVVLAHKYAVRIEIGSSGPNMVRIKAHRRTHYDGVGEKCICKHHPTLDDLIARCEKAKE